MASKEEIKQFISDLEAAVARGEVSEEEGMKMLDEAEAMAKVEVPAEEAKPSFSARIGVSPFEGMMNSITEYNRKKGVSSGEQAEMMKQGLANALDIGTGAGLVRAGVGELAGGSYVDSPDALLKSITEGIPMDILEKEQVLKDSPDAQYWADALLNVADPGMIAGVAGLLKQGIKSGGKSMYRSGLKNIDKMTLKKGKGMNAFSDVAMKHGIAGSSEDIMQQTDAVVEALMKERDALFADAAAKGAVVDPSQALKPVIKKAESIAKDPTKFGKAAKKQAGDLAEEMRVFAQENQYIPERMPEPEQVPGFFAEELPIDQTKIVRGKDTVLESIGPRKIQSPQLAPQTQLAPEFMIDPNQVEQANLFNAAPTDLADVSLATKTPADFPELNSPEFTKWLERKGLTPEEYTSLSEQIKNIGISQLDPSGARIPGTAFLADSPEGIAQFQSIAKTLGVDPDIVQSIYKQRAKQAPLSVEVGRYSAANIAEQQPSFNPDYYSISEPVEQVVTSKKQKWMYPQRSAIGVEPQQTLLRPSDMLEPSKPLLASGGLNPLKASSVKTDMYNMLGSNAFDVLRTDKEGQKLLKRAANRMNIATTNAVKKVDPQAAKRLAEINKDMGALLTGRPAAFNEFSKEVTKNALTSVDAPLAILNPGAFLGKKAADIGKTAQFRTQAGKLLSNDMVAKILGGTGAVIGKGAANAYRNAEE